MKGQKSIETIGFYCGSFDPFHYGHLFVVQKASKIFDNILIGIGHNPDKKRNFNINTMKKAIEETLALYQVSNAKVIVYDMLTSRAAINYNVTHFVRGLRDNNDFDYEEKLAFLNSSLITEFKKNASSKSEDKKSNSDLHLPYKIDDSKIETIYIRAGEDDAKIISSSMIRELIKYNEDYSRFVPEPICRILTQEKN